METLGPINSAALILLGGSLLWAIRLVYGTRDRRGEDMMWRLLTVIGWLLVLAGSLGVLMGLLGWISLGFWLVLLAVLLMAFGRYQDAEQKSLLWVLAIAAEKGIPLSQAVRSLADERSVGRSNHRARRLADLLEQGLPLSEALDASRSALPLDALLAVRMGTRSGRLGPAMRRIVRHDEARETSIRATIERVMYLIFITWISAGVMIFFSVRLAPQYAMLLGSFGITLARPTQWAFNVADTLASVWPLMLLAMLALLFVGLVCLMYYVGWLNTEFPLLGWMWRRHDSALIMRCLAFATDQRLPLLAALVVLSEEFPRSGVRGKLRRAVGHINDGRHWCESLASVGLLRRYERAVLQSAERVGNLAWALDEMADSGMRRAVLWFNTIMGWTLPPLFVLFGLFVGLMAVGMMIPLAQLIQGLT